MVKMIVAVLFILHGLTHSILAMMPSPNAPKPSPAMFFPGLGSRLLARLGLSESTTKTTAILLSVIATLGFIAAGLALFGVLIPFDWWRALAIASAAVSLVLVFIFWDMYLIVGLLIDVAVLVTLLFTKWSPG
ncbi:MAG: hypothetical protein GY832_28650 [Chloroflexi bacterium]|nr:hypothetical protein [Chloroflexota bacterium]